MSSVTEEPRRTVAQELGAHLGLALTFFGSLFVITRVYIVSGRQTGTSLAILRSAGLLPTVLGVITTLLPVVALVASTGLALLALHDLITGRRPARGALAAAVAAVSAAFVPVAGDTLLRLAVLLILPTVAVIRRWQGLASAAVLWGAAVLGSLGLNVLTSDALWLPAERIAVTAPDGTTIHYRGFVLDEGDRIQILNDEPRLILQVEPSTVTERVQCRLTAQGEDGHPSSVLSWLLEHVDVASPRGGTPDC